LLDRGVEISSEFGEGDCFVRESKGQLELWGQMRQQTEVQTYKK